MNPMTLLKIKDKIGTFRKEHPKMVKFFERINEKAMTEGSVMEIKVTTVEGREYASNIRVTANDAELFRILSELGG